MTNPPGLPSEVEDVRLIIDLWVRRSEVSMREIGRITGVSVSNISRFVAGNGDPSLSTYMALREWAFGLFTSNNQPERTQ